MHKILILITFIFILTSCDKTEIDENIYIVSMGYDYIEDDDEVEITLYFISSPTISKSGSTNQTENTSSTATFKGKNQTEIIRKIETSHNQSFQFSHISSYIFTNKYIDNVGFSPIIDQIKRNPRRFPNFYIFATDDEIDDIYSIKNIDNIPTYYSIIFNPIEVKKDHEEVDVMNITTLIASEHEDTLVTTIPYISITDPIFKEGEEYITTVELSGICYYTDVNTCLDIYNNKGIKYIKKSSVFIESIDDVLSVQIKNLDYFLNYKNNVLTFNIMFSFNEISNLNNISKLEIEEELIKLIKYEILDLLINHNEILNIDDYMYRNNINNIDSYSFNFHLTQT